MSELYNVIEQHISCDLFDLCIINTFLCELDELYSTYLFTLNHYCSCIKMLVVHLYQINTFQIIED